MEPKVANLKVKLFADGADLPTMFAMSKSEHIRGLTTNPTLMRKAGVLDYREFAGKVLKEIKELPISFEVFSDDLDDMKRQALEIASWGENVYVKIPVTTSEGKTTKKVINYLANQQVKLNITAVMTNSQVDEIVGCLNSSVPSYISIFAGRISDTGRDPIPTMQKALVQMSSNSKSELIWASPRELLNVFQADSIGCHIITATSDILNKLDLVGKDLTDYSLDTVKMFKNDSVASGFVI